MSVARSSENKAAAAAFAAIRPTLSEEAQAAYARIAGQYRGRGRVLEIGPWLGGGSKAICEALERSSKDWSLTLLDRFTWSAEEAKAHPDVALGAGDSTLSLAKAAVKGHGQKVQLVAGDPNGIAELIPETGPIEQVFVSGAASWRTLWRVLNHIGPALLPEGRLTIHGVLGVAGRQGAWLLGALPQLRLLEASEEADIAVFAVLAPLADFAAHAPQNMRELPTKRLLECWGALATALPELHRATLATGLAMDLLDRGETGRATAVLAESVRSSAQLPAILASLSRLLRKSGRPARDRLLQVIAHLRFGVSPDAVLGAIHRVHSTDEPAAPGSEDGEARNTALSAARLLRDPVSVSALALRHAAYHGLPEDARFRQLYSALQSAHKLGLPPLAKDHAALLPGAQVVNAGPDPALYGLVLRAMGAASYCGLIGEDEADRRSYRNPVTQVRMKSAFSPTDLRAVDPNLRFVTDLQQIEPLSTDLLMLRPPATETTLEHAVTVALRLLRPGGRLYMVWRNPRSWSGHGRAPQTEAELNAADPAQAALIDWQHVKKVNKSVPTLTELRRQIESHFIIDRWDEELDDPAALIRMTSRIQRNNPGIAMPDMICRTVRLIARL